MDPACLIFPVPGQSGTLFGGPMSLPLGLRHIILFHKKSEVHNIRINKKENKYRDFKKSFFLIWSALNPCLFLASILPGWGLVFGAAGAPSR